MTVKTFFKNLNNGVDVSLEQMRKAQERIAPVLEDTRLIESPIFSKESGNRVFIKPENLQKTGAFKIRGAYNKIAQLSDKEKNMGLVASSAGNHAQGVALASSLLGVKSTIVMPTTTPLIKVESTRDYGANIALYGNCYDDSYNEARRLEAEHGYKFIHPFDDWDIMIGQGTIGLEIMDELKDADIILVPVGGGGLISGVALGAKLLNPSVKVIGVEPEGAASMKASLEKGSVATLESVSTIADGVAVKTPGELTYSVCKHLVDDIITVSDFDLMESFLLLLEKHKIVAENSGILPLAALKKLGVRDKKVVCVLSGGNIDVVTVSSMINRGLVSRSRIFCFSVELFDRPGELLKISEILASERANVIQLEHNQFKSFDRLMQVNLEVTVETNGKMHVDMITAALEKHGYKITKIY
ncbi:threonine dehydratase TdcB (plasmid) [Peptoclostridium acidaminophilum DSM 3953]|uniref:L-threonine dehydratase catabolic TdcB n=2 Tax=Peptoclostridium acidaminophilum TaxID=1731 RepID=W8UC29_PEPAC|nr:threonine dehydratase TdcB [Peptoclostridium acidaminophilum DSM 3953]